jgi:hypothetical protein
MGRCPVSFAVGTLGDRGPRINLGTPLLTFHQVVHTSLAIFLAAATGCEYRDV